MIHTARAVKAPSMPVEYSAEQHIVPQTLLHLMPGAAITIAFILLGPGLKANHLPPILVQSQPV